MTGPDAGIIGGTGPLDEAARARAIAEHAIHTLQDDPALTRITDFAAKLCDAPVSVVSIVEAERQNFIARTGIEDDGTPRSMSFCAFTMLGDEIMVIPDARQDPRFAANPLVTGDPFIRFYAGAPIVADDGTRLGALCVIDSQPRGGLTPLQHQGLSLLADEVMHHLRSSRVGTAQAQHDDAARQALSQSENRFRVLADAMPQMVWSTLPDGYHDYYNARWYEFTGMPAGSTDGEGWNGMFHPDDQDRAWALWRHSLSTGDPYQIEYRLRDATGRYRWTLGRALPLRNERGEIVRWFGTCTDIDEHKQAMEQREIISQELSHRIKNIFAVVSGLVAFAARVHPGFSTLAEDLRARITALGRAHDFVRPHSAQSRPIERENTLQGLLGELFVAYQAPGHTRIIVNGDDVPVDDRSATPLALLFHELATNSTKYGALSVADGNVCVDIAIEGEMLALEWLEAGGPRVEPPGDVMGFGTQLIELSVVRQLGGTVDRQWQASGVRVAVTIPLTALNRR